MHQWQSGATATMTHCREHHQHNTVAAPAPPSVDGPVVSAEEVGAAFAFQYFKIMKTRPEDLFRFYNNDSKISRGHPTAAGTVEAKHATGETRIQELLHKEHSTGTRLSLAVINNIESQDSAQGAVLVQITGTLKFVDDTARNFMMSAFLVQQNTTSTGYYVLNDILVFQAGHDNNVSVANTQPAHVDKQEQRRISKTGLSQPQQTRLTQELIDPVTAPIAPSAQPAAAPLPITTAPQLSGATPQLSGASNTPTATVMHDEESFITSTSPALSAKPSEVSVVIEQPLSVVEQLEQQQQPTVIEEASMPDVLDVGDSKNEESNESEMEVIEGIKEEEVTVVEVQARIVERVEHAAPKQEKRNAWKKPASTVAPKGFDEISATSPTEKAKSTTSTGKTTELPTATSSPSTTQPFNPPDASRYPESSYAAKVLRSGPGGLKAPCQTGFAVPPSNENSRPSISDKNSDRKPLLQRGRPAPGSYRNGQRAARGKTLWVSLIPTDMSDEKLKIAVSDQLRGQSCEGHIVRIERIAGQQHGYIELDTEMCAKLLLEKGLYLEGREVSVDFPNRGQNRRGYNQQKVSQERYSEERHNSNQNNPQRGTERPPRRDGTTVNGHQNNIGVTSQSSQENEESGGWQSASRRRPQQTRRDIQNHTQPGNRSNQQRQQSGETNHTNRNFSNSQGNNRGFRQGQGRAPQQGARRPASSTEGQN